MGKSSSSSKKIKPSKDSSKLRLVNKKKKKTKRSKSKKKDYSDETSASDSSFYSSGSDDDYPRRKRRSKKRSRKRYSSSESDDDDDDRLLKKKKRSKRKDERVGTKKKKKKISERKRRERDSSDDGSESDGKRRTRDGVKDMRRRRKDGLEEDNEPADECCQVEDEGMTNENPKRLKSIVVVSYERYEDMVDDHDHVYLRNGENGDSGDRELGFYEGSDSGNEFGEDYRSESSKALKDDDLEAILKKRALENLQRFRGIASKEASSVVQGQVRQYEPERTDELQDHGLMEHKNLRDFEDSQKILHQVDNVSESGTIASQHLGDTVKVTVSSGLRPCSSKRKLIRPVLGQEKSLNLASRKETVGCEDAEAETINGGSIDKDYPESSVALATKNGVENMESTKVSSTLQAQSSSHIDTETLGESQSEQKTSYETKDESQYEQKTMTVMRGGEMVQVSYKVYIPKKTSALGRRKLQR